MSRKCGWADFDFKFREQSSLHKEQQVDIDCGAGYIGELKTFGFLYTFDKEYGGKSDGQAFCDHVEDPTAYYKKPPAVEYQCEEIEDEDEQAICQINKQVQDGIITQADADAELKALGSSRILQTDDIDPYYSLWDNSGVVLPEEFNTE